MLQLYNTLQHFIGAWSFPCRQPIPLIPLLFLWPLFFGLCFTTSAQTKNQYVNCSGKTRAEWMQAIYQPFQKHPRVNWMLNSFQIVSTCSASMWCTVHLNRTKDDRLEKSFRNPRSFPRVVPFRRRLGDFSHIVTFYYLDLDHLDELVGGESWTGASLWSDTDILEEERASRLKSFLKRLEQDWKNSNIQHKQNNSEDESCSLIRFGKVLVLLEI